MSNIKKPSTYLDILSLLIFYKYWNIYKLNVLIYDDLHMNKILSYHTTVEIIETMIIETMTI